MTKRALTLGLMLLFAASTAFSCYLIEGYLRIFYHVPDLIAPYYPFGTMISRAKINARQREYAVDMEYNNQGFRDREFNLSNDGTKKILFLGDSFVEGQGVVLGARSSNLIEKKLNATGSGQYRVFNAGQMATNPISYFENLTWFGLALKPEIVIVGIFMGNDFMDGRSHPVPVNYEIRELAGQGSKKNAGFISLGFLRLIIGQTLTRKTYLVRNFFTDKIWEFYYKEKIGYPWYLKQSGLSKQEFDTRIKKIDPDLVADFFHANINPSYLLNATSSISPVARPA